MRLLNTNNRLPGGFRYEQFDASGRLLHKFQSWDPWMMFLGQIQSFRKGNNLPRQTIEEVEADATEFLWREFGGDPKYFTQNPAQKKTSFSSRFQSRSAALVARGKQLLTGAEISKDWLGDGARPVSKEISQERADICTHQTKMVDGKPTIGLCPHNSPGFKPVEAVASILRLWSEMKNEMKLYVRGEENLHTCQLCWCDLKTKVHVPMATILERTPQSMFDKFSSDAPKNCWMRSPRI